jgi:hypothetical protein
MEVAGDGKDRAVDILRDLDNRLDNAVSGAQGRIMGVFSGPGDPTASQEAVDLVTEAIDLVAQVLASWACAHKTPFATQMPWSSNLLLDLARHMYSPGLTARLSMA